MNTKGLVTILSHGTVFLAMSLCALFTAVAVSPAAAASDDELAKAVLAGGCFWCMEADFDKLDGVKNVVSGYSGGSAETANYKQVSYEETGHYEVVQIEYDPRIVSYAQLLDHFWKNVDPTDPDGQFCDKGSSYRTAIFYANEEEKEIAESSLENVKLNKPFKGEIVTPLLPAKPFYKAEDYHQNYYQRNPIRYKFYRSGCRRDKRLEELWGTSR